MEAAGGEVSEAVGGGDEEQGEWSSSCSIANSSSLLSAVQNRPPHDLMDEHWSRQLEIAEERAGSS